MRGAVAKQRASDIELFAGSMDSTRFRGTLLRKIELRLRRGSRG